jgi:2-oxoglutarate dehydrogenase E2 component (dihydrolipoamide succinyltransferase)
VAEDEPIAEIATDKVDSEIVSSKAGTFSARLVEEGTVVPVGKAIAELDVEGGSNESVKVAQEPVPEPSPVPVQPNNEIASIPDQPSTGTRFYSPLVRNIAKQENISFGELDSIPASGKGDRLTKQDVLDYIDRRKSLPSAPQQPQPVKVQAPVTPPMPVFTPGASDTIVEMDRIRQLIANHMVRSVQTSPHVTSFAEADVTRLVQWREKNKDAFQKKENSKLTFTPIFIEAMAKAARDYPMVNVSVDGTKIVVHKNINIGMAVALPSDNLIVPVIRNADQKNLFGIIKDVNDIANRARLNKLMPDEITGGTLSLTNLGSFGTLMGTPIINQPQCAIVAVGAIRKRPVVIETPEGDTIAIRHMMMVSITYDHRVVDGALGGKYLSRFVEYLEQFDTTLSV